MTRPARSALVVDGETVRVRLVAEREASSQFVHVDWLRFTLCLRDAPFDLDVLFPPTQIGTYWEVRDARMARQLAAIQLEENYSAAGQALTLAREVVDVLGEGFEVGGEPLKGHDFYAKRWPIEWNGNECGWVGYGASSTSPRQQKQAKTIHCNLYGMACTFARHGWRTALADKLDQWQATVTRCDLALDFFDGFNGGLDAVVDDFKSGGWDVNGQRPKVNQVGDWINGKGRSFYAGSKEAGKQTNVYEKGHQLYGVDSGSPWIRFELRYGNKLRELDTDMLRRPDDFFAGASEAHARALQSMSKRAIHPEPIQTKKRLELTTVDAEVTRNVRWLERVAAPSMALAFKYLGQDEFLSLVEHRALPRRLSKYAGYLADAVRNAGEAILGRGIGASPHLAYS
ncbi:replication initiation factor domain-containing protein [Ottowia testudinis]|uniref:Replication initiation factor domain-containing protein n=1 Tax=Ottowia testudinis TaxID=2816950 RepID=A0A975CDB2_9BURK|nr:replication initiation factor domain-containing protein [Ottowia testudinis]QTD44300.1 replication initiation factor domain-containing protein [Ottowia testudinis]